jgi:adenosylcobinamide kinase / adenosylcobinamide-phosphate guanylyltransferase
MGRVVLVTGGSRSGKSAFAQNLAEEQPGARAYLATCPLLDDEMRERARKHREAREGRGWTTIEEPSDLVQALRRAPAGTVLVECLTLWVNNLMYEAEQGGRAWGEAEMSARAGTVLAACRDRAGMAVFVTNEVGWGIVPENALARRFRDLAGRCNQAFAAEADEVWLVVCGQSLKLKG